MKRCRNNFALLMPVLLLTGLAGQPSSAAPTTEVLARVHWLGLTRVSADVGMRRFIEQRLQPVVRRLGFRTAEFAWSRYADWVAATASARLVEHRALPPLGHFSLVRFAKTDAAASAH